MNRIIDNLNVITGWSGTGTVHGLNSHADYIAGHNTASIVFKFDALNEYVEKIYGIDVTNYDILTVYLYSRNKQNSDFRKLSDFVYKIDLGSGKEYYLSAYPGFAHIIIDISDITSIDRIRITALHADEDYLIMSYVVVSKDEIPLDIFEGIKTGMEYHRDTLNSYLLGTINCTAGNTSINLTGFNYIDDYAIIKIDDGINDEIHQIIRGNEGLFNLTDLYDGNEILYTYVNASVYLYFPVEFGRSSLEAIIPGITIWGFEPEEKLESFKLDNVLDTWKSSGVTERREGHYMNYPVQFDCEARHNEILAHLTRIVRDFIGRNFVWINGRKFEIKFDGGAIETFPTEHYDLIPKVLYRGTLEIREELWTRTILPYTGTINTAVNIL